IIHNIYTLSLHDALPILVVMTPKSLLRHPRVVSPLEDLAQGSFQPILDDTQADASKVEKLVLCSGKLYYELLTKKEELACENIALVRLEQLYPLQQDKVDEVLEKYSNRKQRSEEHNSE